MHPAVDIPDPSCAQSDPELWFPETGASPDRAKIICYGCPGILQCRDYALRHPGLYGVWGGMTARERTAARLTVLR